METVIDIGMDGLLLITDESRPLVRKNITEHFEKPYEVKGVRKDGMTYEEVTAIMQSLDATVRMVDFETNERILRGLVGTFEAPPENYGYAVRKADTELLETLNKGLALLMADPYWQELKKKYNIQ